MPHCNSAARNSTPCGIAVFRCNVGKELEDPRRIRRSGLPGSHRFLQRPVHNDGSPQKRLSARVDRLAPSSASLLFIVYSGLTGVTLSFIARQHLRVPLGTTTSRHGSAGQRLPLDTHDALITNRETLESRERIERRPTPVPQRAFISHGIGDALTGSVLREQARSNS